MPKPKKQSKPSANKAPAKPVTPTPAGGFHQTVHGIFGKIQAKTGLSDEKLDKFQEAWLKMPETRRKYEHLTDAPLVAIEEGMAMANDILDFLQNEESGKSLVFKGLKEEAHELVSHPVDYFKNKFNATKSFVEHLKETIQGEAKEARERAEKSKKPKG